MKAIADVVISIYERNKWLEFFIFWVIWIGGAIFEYQIHRNKQVTLGWLYLCLGVLIYMLYSSDDQLGIYKWGLICLIAILAAVGISKFSKYANTPNK
jgi:hypothetical protein